MKKYFRLNFLLAGILLFSGLVAGCRNNSSSDAEYVLKFGHLANEQNIWHKAAVKFSELVHQKTDGRVEVKVYPNEQLGNEMDMLTGIRAGTVDMTITGESLQNWSVPEAVLCAIPYMVRDSEHMQKVAGGPIGQRLEKEIFETTGFKPVAWFERGARHLTSNRPIKKPEDLNGMILRVPNVPLFVKTWQALGAKPTPMAFSEVFTSLQQGAIHGQENPFALIHSASFFEVQDYCNLTGHVKSWIYVVIGKKSLQKLPEALRKMVLESAKEMQAYQHQLFQKQNEVLAKELQEKGMEFVEVDRQAFQEKAEKAVKASLPPQVEKLYQQVKKIQ